MASKNYLGFKLVAHCGLVATTERPRPRSGALHSQEIDALEERVVPRNGGVYSVRTFDMTCLS